MARLAKQAAMPHDLAFTPEKRIIMTIRWIIGTALSACICLPLQAQDKPERLSPESLARCASQVQTLRDDSRRLAEQSIALDRRREGIEERSAMLRLERDNQAPEDVEAGLAFKQRLIEHSAQTLAFNAEISAMREEINALNALKFDYDQRCARRAYRRADLEALPADAQKAMRDGLGDVKVPYISDAGHDGSVSTPVQ